MRSLFICFAFLVLEVCQAKAQFPSPLDTITKTTSDPYDKVCYLYITRAHPFGSGYYESTGAFIAPNIILTAAHNIYSPVTSKVTKITIVPGKYYKTRPFDSLVIKGENACDLAIRTHPNYSFLMRSANRMKWDFGIIIIPDDVLKSNPKITSAQAFVLDTTYVLKEGDTLNVAGYPADYDYGYNGNFMTHQSDLCGRVYPKTFYHQLDTYRGNSGSPIWVNVNGKRIIAGVHTFENAGTRLDKDDLDILYGWLKHL